MGATPLDWSYKTRCGGATLSITQPAMARRMTEKILQNAKRVGADAVVVACPLCQVNLDTRQGKSVKSRERPSTSRSSISPKGWGWRSVSTLPDWGWTNISLTPVRWWMKWRKATGQKPESR